MIGKVRHNLFDAYPYIRDRQPKTAAYRLKNRWEMMEQVQARISKIKESNTEEA